MSSEKDPNYSSKVHKNTFGKGIKVKPLPDKMKLEPKPKKKK